MGTERKDLENVLSRVVDWAGIRSDIRAVALVGSYARGAERTDSDIDVVVLTSNPDRYTSNEGWVSELGLGKLVRTEDWGAIKERRLRLPDGLEVEVGIGEPTWASIDPVDPGTRQIVTDGMRRLYDPDGLLLRLQSACS